MEKKRSERLAILVSLAQGESEEAASAFEQARNLHEVEKKKLLSLKEYFEEYSSVPNGTVCKASDMSRQRNFLGQIYEARDQQEILVNRYEHLVSQRQDDWQKKHMKHKALCEMVERAQMEENKILARKEEKLLDDWYLQTMQSRNSQRE